MILTSGHSIGNIGQCERQYMRNKLMVAALICIFFPLAGASVPAEGAGADNKVVTRDILGNGLKVVIVRNRLSPVVTTVVNYLVGSNEAPEGYPGMAHAQEHMMFRGSPGLTADQLADITASMGGMFDADTQQSVTQYFFTVPFEDLEVALRIEAIRMSGVLDSEKLWSQERGAIEQEVAQDLSNPEYMFYTRLLSTMFRGTPYSHDALGSKPSFDRTTGEMLRKFYDTWYAPNNAILIVAGDVEPRTALAMVKKLFGGIPRKKLPPRQEIALQPVMPETIRLKSDLPYGLAIISFRMPGYDSLDYAAAKLVTDVLNSPRGDLYELSARGKALFTAFNMDNLSKSGIAYATAGFPQGGDPEQLIRDLRSTLHARLEAGIQADMVEAAKRREMTDSESQKDSVFGQAMAWSQALAVEGRESPEDDSAAIRNVTLDDVNRVFRKYITMDRAITAILTPEISGKPVSSKGFGGKESFTLAQTKEIKLPNWAEKALTRISAPKSTVHPVVTKLANGITLIVQTETASRMVNVYGHIKNNPDLQAPQGKEGVNDVLKQLFPFGTVSLDRIAFQKALDSIGAYVSAGTDFSLQTLSEYFDRGAALLADNELHPALPEEYFEIIRRQAAQSVSGMLKSPDYLAGKALKTALYPTKDPTLREPTPATLNSLSLRDVKDYYHCVYRPDMTIIVVIGDITPDKARGVLEKYFGAWKSTGPRPDVLLPSTPPNRPATIAVPDTSRVQDQVLLAETLHLTRSNADYYALELGNHVLGGGFYATRLYQDLREKSGLVYFVSSSFQVGKTRAVYRVDYACDPSNVSRARAMVVRNLQTMRQAPVSPGELRQARSMLLREIPLAESSIRHIAAGLISRSVLDLPLDEPTVAARHFLTITAGQVRDAFRKYIRPADLVQVTEGPAPR
jgi:zinc protease